MTSERKSLLQLCPSCGAPEACDNPEKCRGWINPGDAHLGAADLAAQLDAEEFEGGYPWPNL